MVIYMDMLFLENFILDFIILYVTGLISKNKIKFLKLIFGSALGAIYVVMYYFIKINVYSNIIIKLLLSIIMIYISFVPTNFKEMLKLTVFFYLTSFVFGGAALSVIYMLNSRRITIQNGILIGNYTIRTIFIGVVIACIVTIIAFKFVKAKFSKNDLFCNIIIKINNKQIKTKAMLDTGNFLKDPITNIPVVVVEYTVLYDMVPKEILDNIEDILGGDLEKIPENIKNEYMSKLKVIPFSSLGKQNGMLLGLKADGLIVDNEEEVKNIDNVIIGIYNKKLSKKGDYSALLGFDTI